MTKWDSTKFNFNCTWCRFHKKSLVNKDKKNIFLQKKKTKTKNASHFHNTCLFRKISAKAVLIKKKINKCISNKKLRLNKVLKLINIPKKPPRHDTRSRNATNEKKNQFLTFEKKRLWHVVFFSLFFVYIKRSCCFHFDC